jgi:hypothetical protein
VASGAAPSSSLLARYCVGDVGGERGRARPASSGAIGARLVPALRPGPRPHSTKPLLFRAEGEGFEPPRDRRPLTAFKAAAFSRSATPPVEDLG